MSGILDVHSNPLITVILPTFNRTAMLRRAITSVLAQTWQDFEVIVVDDCSENRVEVKGVVTAFSDPRIRYIRHDSNRGGAAARNTGIRAAKGEYVAFLDDDDEWHRDKLEKQSALFKHSLLANLGVVYGGFAYVSADGNEQLEMQPRFRGDVSLPMLRSCLLGSATPLIKKELFSRTGYFDEAMPSCQDWDMWIRISQHCTFDFVSGVTAHAFVHGDQMSGSLEKKIEGRMQILEKNADFLQHHPKILAQHLERVGLLLMLAKRRSESITFFRQAIRVNRGRVRAYAHLLLSLILPAFHRYLMLRRGLFHFDGKQFYY